MALSVPKYYWAFGHPYDGGIFRPKNTPGLLIVAAYAGNIMSFSFFGYILLFDFLFTNFEAKAAKVNHGGHIVECAQVAHHA